MFDSRTLTVEEFVHVKFNESGREISKLEDELPNLKLSKDKSQKRKMSRLKVTTFMLMISMLILRTHIGTLRECFLKRKVDIGSHHWRYIFGTRSSFREEYKNITLLYDIEPKSIYEALKDYGWIAAMQEELNQFTMSKL